MPASYPRPAERAVFHDEAVKPRLKAHFPAEGEDLLPDPFHHVHQHVGADVGLCVKGHALRRAVGGELLQHPEHAPVVGAGVELPVREGAGPALAELDVGLRVQRPAPAKGFDGKGPLLHRLAALKDDGLCPGPGQQQRREHARRAEAHDHRPLCGSDLRDLIDRRRVGRGVLPGIFQRPLFPAPERHGGGAGVVNVVFLACVQGALHGRAFRDLTLRHAQLFRRLLP